MMEPNNDDVVAAAAVFVDVGDDDEIVGNDAAVANDNNVNADPDVNDNNNDDIDDGNDNEDEDDEPESDAASSDDESEDMDEINDDDEEDDVDDAEDADDFVVLDPAERNRICNKVMSILLHREEFPTPLRDSKIVEFAQQFLDNVGAEIEKFVTDTRTIDEGYQGLDSVRDTEAEVTTMLGFYPEVLSQTEETWNMVPIQCLPMMVDNDGRSICNTQAVSFVHLFIALAMQFNSFEEHERGGLLIEDEDGKNTLHFLVTKTHPNCQQRENCQFIDSTYLAVLIRLRQSNFLKREDIIPNELVHHLCGQQGGDQFHKERFRFLTGWCPESLHEIDDYGFLPLHVVAMHDGRSIEPFRCVLNAEMRYFPYKIGINMLFKKDIDGDTPFEMAVQCWQLCRGGNVEQRRKEVMDLINTTLTQYSTTSPTPLRIGDALIVAATDDSIHLDCVYFLTRRHPDKICGMLRHHRRDYQRITTEVASSTNKIGGSTNDGTDNDDTSNSNNNSNLIVRRGTRKRKKELE